MMRLGYCRDGRHSVGKANKKSGNHTLKMTKKNGLHRAVVTDL